MNSTNFQHLFIGIFIQVIIAFGLLLLGVDPVNAFAYGGTVATTAFFVREYHQIEAKIVKRGKFTLTDLMPWHVMKPDEWTTDAWLDWIPVAAINTMIVMAVLYLVETGVV
jgi:hypothetical protein